MILQPKQAKRFYRCFDTLIIYANTRLKVVSNLINRFGEIDDDAAFSIAMDLWEKQENRQIIADFARDNPSGLSRQDLAEVAQWENAICDSFGLLRKGSDTYVMYGNHAIAVRGITREIDMAVRSIPTMVKTVILPFDGRITYAMSLLEYDVSIGPDMLQGMTEDLEGAIRERHVIRSAKELLEQGPALVQSELDYRRRAFRTTLS